MIAALLRGAAHSAQSSPWQWLARALWGGSLPLTRAQGVWLARLMLLPTLAWLVFALAYLAQLADLPGTLAPHARLQQVAEHGQWLGGTAVTLLVLSCLLRKGMRLRWGVGRTLLWGLISCSTGLYLGYHSQRLLLDNLVHSASPAQQAQAAYGIPLLNRLLEHDLQLDGQRATPAQLATPEGKLRLAGLALQLPYLSPLPAIDGLTPQGFFEQLADQQRGGLARNYERYRQATARQEDNYRQYRRASQFYFGATSRLAIIQRQGQAWDDYLRLLGQRGRNINPWTLPASEWQSVRHVLREQMNVPVNDMWRPDDRPGFNRAVAGQVRRDARNQYAEMLQQRIGAGWIEPGMDRPMFLGVDAIQAQWRQDLDLPAGITLYAYQTEQAFDSSAYQPALQHDAREMIKRRVANADDLSTLGADSYRDLVTPAVSLLLVLIGVALHLFRALAYLLRLLQPQPLSLYLKLLVAYALLLGSLPLLAGKAQVAGFEGGELPGWTLPWASRAVDWAAPLQGRLYPLGSGIAEHWLGQPTR